MERKIDPNNPSEVNLPPGSGLVYIFREPVVGNMFNDASSVEAQIMANGKTIAVMPNANYFIFTAPAGDVKFAIGKLTQRNIQKDNIEEELWPVKSDEATIKVKPSYVYYLKLKVVSMEVFLSAHLENVPHQDGANLINSYKLTQLRK
jgi:hypothetical protein